MFDSESNLPDPLREALSALLSLRTGPTGDVAAFEVAVQVALRHVGRTMTQERLEALSPQGAFVEDGVRWSPAVVGNAEVITLFGPIRVTRPLFRRVRNGSTRCLVTERATLVGGLWTQPAARVAALAAAEMPFERVEEFLAEAGVVCASKSSVLRLVEGISERWEQNRVTNEQAVRETTPIPQDATLAAFSLDGVMLMMTDSDRAGKKARARAHGQADKGPSGFREASVGVVSFYNADGQRLSTRRYGRMPESDKATTKAWLAAEFEAVLRDRPDIKTLAIADGAANNWSFLGGLRADYELVDFFHAAEHLHRHANGATVASSVETQNTLREMRRLLLDVPGAAEQVFRQLQHMREQAGTAAVSTQKAEGKRQPTFFERHSRRMAYAEARAAHRPIGTGVTESTCKLTICDRMRRTGMRWSHDGGQAVLTLRALQTSGQFGAAWSIATARA